LGALWEHFIVLVLLALPQHLQFLVGLLCVGKIHRVISLKPAGRFMASQSHDHRLVYPCLPHIGVEGMAKIMEPKIINTGHPAGPPETSFD
jgi:hypothetical protein